MTIYEIKERTRETAPHFFDRKTLKFFGQTMKMFRVYDLKNGKYLVVCPMSRPSDNGSYRIACGETRRIFNPETNTLEREV